MKISDLGLEGCFLIHNFVAKDHRGTFVKTFNEFLFREQSLQTSFKESYYSKSMKGVVRGMHFQLPPFDHEKLVYLTSGRVLDVILDLRKLSPTCGRVASVELDSFSESVYIPKGCAHGFITLSEEATVVYNVSTVYSPEHDSGIHWQSIPFKWPINDPIISDRDAHFIRLSDFTSPF